MAFSPDGSRFVVGTRRDVDLWWSLARTNGGPQAVTPPGLDFSKVKVGGTKTLTVKLEAQSRCEYFGGAFEL